MEEPKTDEQSWEGPPLRLWRWATASGEGMARDTGLLLLRVITSLLMMPQHGWGILLSFSDRAQTWADPIGLGSEVSLALAIGAEFFCSILVAVGYVTRLAAIPLVFTMLVAAGVVHWEDPFSKKEFALLYFVPFVTLILTGAGRYSIDGWIAHKRGT